MEIQLNVPQILQKPELPNGCEITSLCEVLNYLGFNADKCDLADHHLPRSEYWKGADPDLVYMGNPHRDDDSPECGYYCFAGPILAAAESYLAANGASRLYIPADLTGAEEAELIEQLKEGRPFVFWASLHFNDIKYDRKCDYVLPDGRVHHVFHELHCMVCCGVDDTCFTIADPLDYNRRIPREQFMKIYRQLGSRALVIKPV